MGEKTMDKDVSRHVREDDGSRLETKLLRCCFVGWTLAFSAAQAAAGTEVVGQADQLELRADHASTREALDALARAFGLTYQLTAEVSREHSGRYYGTLNQVLGRILDGNNYVVKPLEEGLEVIVLGKSGTAGIAPPVRAIVAATPASPAPSNVASAVPSSLSELPPAPAVPTLSTATPPPLASYLAN
jgi:hypothetical protein